MLPRSKLTKRLAAAARIRQSRRLSSSTVETGEIKPKQAKTADHEIREKARRIKKAERDERMDITMSMTPVKEYMGGFTRPRDLRISNWFPGGAYLAKRKKYEPPPPEAYTSHTVFLLETRYPVRHELGRKDAIEHFVGVCRTGDFPAILRKMNSLNSPSEARLAMDNAIWPWVHPKAIKRQVWWEKGETLQETLARLEEEDEAAVQAMVEWEEKRERERPMEEEEEKRQAQEATSSRYQRNGLRHPDAQRFFKRQGQGRQPGSHDLVATELLHPEGSDSQMLQRRMFHFSLRAAADEPGSFESRMTIPGSSWSRPPKPSQDSDESTVPTYYVERKKQRAAISERKEEEGGLMAELSAGILSDNVAAKTRARPEKIPVEVRDPEEGSVRHPSGFEPPTPETHFHPAAAKVATENNPILATVKQLWDERPPNAEAPEYDANVESELARKKTAVDVDDPAAVLMSKARTEQGPAGTFDALSSSDADLHASSSEVQRSIPTRRRRPEPHPEDLVSQFYIERKQEVGGLMAELDAGIHGEGLAAETKERAEKIPVEVRDPRDGTVRHPSGFKPPTPETHFHPASAKVPTEDHPIVSTVKVPWTEAGGAVAKRENGNDNSAGGSGGSGSVGAARGLHTSAIVRATEVQDAALGFMSSALDEEPMSASEAAVSPKVRFHNHAREMRENDLEEDDEYEDEEEDVNAEVVEGSLDELTKALRGQYLPTLAQYPFWRPLLTVTLGTRPLATTLVRLSRGMPRGTPFYATIEPEERLALPSFPSRMRNLRLNRMEGLTLDIARLLAGERGGFLGFRWNTQQRGRGINGEQLEEPIPEEFRTIQVGVGEWYEHAEDVKEWFREDAKKAGVEGSMEVFGLDDKGARTDGVPWPLSSRTTEDSRPMTLERFAKMHGVSFEGLKGREYKNARDAFEREHFDELAAVYAKGHSTVFAVKSWVEDPQN